MQTLEELQVRIASAGDLHSLTKTMKALAAVNIHLLEEVVATLRAYRHTIDLGLRALMRAEPGRATIVRPGADRGPAGVIAFGSDQGLCGSLNEQVAAEVVRSLESGREAHGEVGLWAMGARLAEHLGETGHAPIETFPSPSSGAGILDRVRDLITDLDRWQRDRELAELSLVHAVPRGQAAYRVVRIPLLPLDRSRLDGLRAAAWPTRQIPEAGGDPRGTFSSLVRHHVFVACYRAVAESMASENASRLAAMQRAERNIRDRLGELREDYLRRRQMAITEELLDVVAGFEVLALKIREAPKE